MSDEDEDYMSDAFLAKLDDVKPSLIQNRSVKRQYEIEEKQRELQLKKSKPIHQQEKEQLKEGLTKAISSDNKGFAMLSKMGFKPGTSLGKSSEANIKIPISINLNNIEGRHGLGTHTAAKEKQEEIFTKLKERLKASDMTPDEFRAQQREVNEKRQTIWDLHKLQKTCRIIELEHHIKFPIHPFFWPEEKVKDSDEDSAEEEKKPELSVS